MTEFPSVFIDSSAWISYLIPSDSNFQKAVNLFQSFSSDTKLYTSLFIIDEVITKIRRTLGQKEVDKFYSALTKLEKQKSINIILVTKEIIKQAMHLLHNSPTPNTLSLTDATNVVLVKKHLIHALITFDSDFKKFKRSGLITLP